MNCSHVGDQFPATMRLPHRREGRQFFLQQRPGALSQYPLPWPAQSKKGDEMNTFMHTDPQFQFPLCN